MYDQFSSGSVGIVHSQPGLHLSIWMILPIAGIITAVAGVVIGLPTLRLRGDYLAIVTLGFGEMIRVIITNVDAVGAARGLPGIPGWADLFWVGLGVIGCGGFVQYHLRPLAEVCPEFKIVALCDIDATRPNLKKLRETFPKAKFYTDFRKMLLEMDDQIDAVGVANRRDEAGGGHAA